MANQYGEGWAGALPDRVNTWSITQALSAEDLDSAVGDGLLPAGHFSGSQTVCLEDGYYSFTSIAHAAWSDEDSWTLCGVEGWAGGTLEFEVIWRHFASAGVGRYHLEEELFLGMLDTLRG